MNHRITEEDHRTLAVWAADCAAHVLHFFEEAHPEDSRPHDAIESCRRWVRTGEFGMAAVRKRSLDAHAAAREAEEGSAARFAARAAGQAAATPHVPSHAVGPAWYGAKAADAAGVPGEREWQYARLPEHLREFVRGLGEERPGIAKVLRYPEK